MQIEITKKERTKSLYDTGQRTPIVISRGAGVSDRTARRYIKEFKEGGSHERKPCPQRKMTKRTSQLERKVLRKARNRRRIWSTRAIGSSAGISHTIAGQIMIEKGIKFRS